MRFSIPKWMTEESSSYVKIVKMPLLPLKTINILHQLTNSIIKSFKNDEKTGGNNAIKPTTTTETFQNRGRDKGRAKETKECNFTSEQTNSHILEKHEQNGNRKGGTK
jgi:hypothetical protein